MTLEKKKAEKYQASNYGGTYFSERRHGLNISLGFTVNDGSAWTGFHVVN